MSKDMNERARIAHKESFMLNNFQTVTEKTIQTKTQPKLYSLPYHWLRCYLTTTYKFTRKLYLRFKLTVDE